MIRYGYLRFLNDLILVIRLQYLQFLKVRFFADTIQISVIEAQLRLAGDISNSSTRISIFND